MTRIWIAMICGCVFSYSVAQPNFELTDTAAIAHELQEIVVTGTRTPKSLKSVPVHTRLISSSDLHRADATDLQALLQQELPGVEFSYAMNQQVNMNLAGFSGLGVLVLLDGERLAGETMDNVDFSRLPMANVQRIEIIRGAASALYGSNAAGGVINIITKKAIKALSVDAQLRSGSHGEWRAGVSVGNKGSRLENMLDVQFSRIGTFDVCLHPDDDCDYRKVYGHRVWNASDRLSLRVSPDISFTGRVGYYFKERYYNVDMPERYRAYSGGIRGQWHISDYDNLEVSYSFDQYDKSDYIRAYNRDIRDYSNVQHTVKALYTNELLSSHILTLGGDLTRDMLCSYQFESTSPHLQVIADMFAQYDWSLNDDIEIVGAVRADWFSDNSSGCLSPKLNARWSVGNTTMRGGYASGFRAPSLKEKYMNFNMADIFDIHGNADLKPEKSHNLNFSVEYTWRNYYFMVGAAYNLVHNKIATSGILYDAEHDPYIRYINVEDLKVVSADASIRAHWPGGLSAAVGYNFTQEHTHGGGVVQYCPARPHSINVRLSWLKQWQSGCDTDLSLSGRCLSHVSYESMYMYEPFESQRITNPGYTLWKLQIAQRLSSMVQITVAVDNLLNYRPKIYTFNAPVTTGTSFLIGINYNISK